MQALAGDLLTDLDTPSVEEEYLIRLKMIMDNMTIQQTYFGRLELAFLSVQKSLIF